MKRAFARTMYIAATCTVAAFGVALIALGGLWGGTKFAHASGFTSFTFATSTSPYVSASVDLAAGQWLVEAIPHVGAASGSGTTGCEVNINTSVPSTKYNGTFRITTDNAWKPQGGEAAHAVINLSADTVVSVSLSYSPCNGGVNQGTNSVSYLFFPISATSGFQYVTTGGAGPTPVDSRSQITLPSASITLPAGTWLMEDTPGVVGGGGANDDGGCQFIPNVTGVTPSLQQRGSFRVYVYETMGAIEDPGYAVFTTTAPTTVRVSTSYVSCSAGGSPTTQKTNFVMYKFFQVQSGQFQYVQNYGSVPLTAGGWTVETSLGVVGAGGNNEGCNFNTFLQGANPPVSGSCSNTSPTCQTDELTCTSAGSCNGGFGSCTDQYTCEQPSYVGGCGGTWVNGCSGTWNPSPSNAWSQDGGFSVYTYNTQAAGQRSDFLGINLSAPATVRPNISIFNCSTNPQYGSYYNTNHSMYLFFSNSPAPPSTGNLTVTSENSVVPTTFVKADWSQGAFTAYPSIYPCDVASCTGTEQTYPSMPTGTYILSPSLITSLATTTFVLHSVEQVPIAQKHASNPLLSFLENLFNVAKAKVVCGWSIINGVASPSSCPNDTPSLTISDSGDTANFIILWDPLAAISVSPSAVSLSATAGSTTSTQVTLTNSGSQGSTLNWTATSDKPWLTVWQSSGSLNAANSSTLTLTANSSGLSAGTYTGTVTFNGTSSPATNLSNKLAVQTITVTFTVGAALPPPPPPPSCTFGASPQQIVPPGQSTLSWTCTNAVSCQLDGAAVPTNGSEQVSPTTNTTYTLSCNGSGSGPTNTFTTQTTVTTQGPNVHEINP